MLSPLQKHIESLFSLCNMPLTYPVIRQRTLELGWRLDEDDPQQFVLRVEFDDKVSLFVASLAPRQPFGRCIYLPLFFTDDPYDCITAAAEDKPAFDVAYTRAKSQVEGELGAPDGAGDFEFFGGTYQAAMWRGTHAVLALIQDDFDVQFGSEISIWIIECKSDEPFPALPPHN